MQQLLFKPVQLLLTVWKPSFPQCLTTLAIVVLGNFAGGKASLEKAAGTSRQQLELFALTKRSRSMTHLDSDEGHELLSLDQTTFCLQVNGVARCPIGRPFAPFIRVRIRLKMYLCKAAEHCKRYKSAEYQVWQSYHVTTVTNAERLSTLWA